ncbi:helix-turn-helix transcriptional regulator [Micromonospora chersina]|uniref:helix-turn-helix transcriptional regulator n=1 Tax=Micromonospora chersina TaxID=47854 RepID=UPI0033A9861C
MALKRHRLCQRRKALGFSQERLAELLGVERSTVVRWENAETDPQPRHRTRIASALGVTLEQLDDMLVDVSVAAHRGQAMGDDARSPASGAARPDLLSSLRTFLTSYLTVSDGRTPSLADVRRGVGRVHHLYQRASYTSAARLLPDVLSQATALTGHTSGLHRSSAFRLLAAAYIAASKLGAKVGDGDTALLTADRASTAAGLADDQALAAVAAYQAACALMLMPGRAGDAEQIVLTSVNRLGAVDDPDLLSAQGALVLLAAVMAAGQGNSKDAGQFLARRRPGGGARLRSQPAVDRVWSDECRHPRGLRCGSSRQRRSGAGGRVAARHVAVAGGAGRSTGPGTRRLGGSGVHVLQRSISLRAAPS